MDAAWQDWGVREVAARLGVSPSSAHRLLNLLQREGWIEADGASGRYRASLEFFRSAWRVAAAFPLHRAALPVMQSLVAACNETAFLGVYEPTRMEMMFLTSVESAHPLRYVVAIQEWLPVHVGASGLAIMAFLSAAERRAIVERTRLAPVTARSVTAPDALERELETVRRRGYACSHGQRIPGAVGMAAPVWGPAGRVVGDLVLTIPEQRFDAAAEPALAGLVVAHAHRITRELGGVPDVLPLPSQPAPARPSRSVARRKSR
jgi:IclR family acetate operon transcriptional repressor